MLDCPDSKSDVYIRLPKSINSITICFNDHQPGPSPADAIIAAMETPPSAQQQELIHQTVDALLETGLWEKMDVLYFLKSHAQQASRLNWKSPGIFTLGVVGSPSWTSNGWMSSVLGDYLNTGYKPGTDGIRYKQDSAHLAMWSMDDLATNANGCGGDAGANWLMGPRRTTDAMRVKVNDASNTTGVDDSVSDSLGLFVATRTGPEVLKGYHGTVQVVEGAITSEVPNAVSNLILLAGNPVTAGDGRRYAFASAGTGLTAGQVVDLNDIVSNYVSNY